jgi:hypothetical protein
MDSKYSLEKFSIYNKNKTLNIFDSGSEKFLIDYINTFLYFAPESINFLLNKAHYDYNFSALNILTRKSFLQYLYVFKYGLDKKLVYYHFYIHVINKKISEILHKYYSTFHYTDNDSCFSFFFNCLQ